MPPGIGLWLSLKLGGPWWVVPGLMGYPVSGGFLPPSSSVNQGECIPPLAGGLLLPGRCPGVSLLQSCLSLRDALLDCCLDDPLLVSFSQRPMTGPSIGSTGASFGPRITRQQLLCLCSAARASSQPTAHLFSFPGWSQIPRHQEAHVRLSKGPTAPAVPGGKVRGRHSAPRAWGGTHSPLTSLSKNFHKFSSPELFPLEIGFECPSLVLHSLQCLLNLESFRSPIHLLGLDGSLLHRLNTMRGISLTCRKCGRKQAKSLLVLLFTSTK